MEACDNLNGIDTAPCNGHNPGPNDANNLNAKCQVPRCGDGYVNNSFIPPNANMPEECDNGSSVDMPDCNGNNKGNNGPGSCRKPLCGDGYVNDQFQPPNFPTTEQCDNGTSNNNDTADGCRTDCRRAFCGDGVIDTGEECDPGGVPNIRQHYLDIVLLTRPGLRVGPVSIYVLLGGGLSILAHATSEDSTGMSQDVTSDLRRLDITLLAGAGVALPLPRSALRSLQLSASFLEVRHDQGMIDIDMANGGFKNRTNSIMLGLSFALTARPSATPLTQSAQSSR